VDTLGELPILYAASDLAFVGGSLVRHGGHNMLEPAALGVPVLTGRHVFNFSEITGILSAAGALEQVSTVKELASKVCQLLEDANLRHAMGERGRQVVRDNQGTLARLIESLEETVPLIGSQ
jgi:3-deoxy-D-manno-octulosonic-acid transferase